MTKVEIYSIYAVAVLLLGSVFYEVVAQGSGSLGANGWMVAMALLLLYGELFVMREDKEPLRYVGYLGISFVGITLWGYFSATSIFVVFYYILGFQMIRGSSLPKGILSMIGMTVTSQLIYFDRFPNFREGFSRGLTSFVFSMIAILVMILIGYILIQNKELLQVKEKLMVQNLDLRRVNQELQSAYHEVEEYTIMKERTALSREMHDTVGHTLTTALVELEVCKMLCNEQSEVKEKMSRAIEKVRFGLQELRLTVRHMQKEKNWKEEILRLGNQLKEETGITLKYIADQLEELSQEQLKCVYRFLQEGITNGIKHGQANAFLFQLVATDRQFEMLLMDNGKGTTVIDRGFGLKSMGARIEELRGRLEMESVEGEGFTLKMTLPRGRSNDSNRNCR